MRLVAVAGLLIAFLVTASSMMVYRRLPARLWKHIPSSELRMNRPFMFLLYDKGTILFTGRVVNPFQH